MASRKNEARTTTTNFTPKAHRGFLRSDFHGAPLFARTLTSYVCAASRASPGYALREIHGDIRCAAVRSRLHLTIDERGGSASSTPTLVATAGFLPVVR